MTQDASAGRSLGSISAIVVEPAKNAKNTRVGNDQDRRFGDFGWCQQTLHRFDAHAENRSHDQDNRLARRNGRKEYDQAQQAKNNSE